MQQRHDGILCRSVTTTTTTGNEANLGLTLNPKPDIYIYICKHPSIYIHIYVYMCVCVCISIYMYTCIHLYIWISIYVYVCIIGSKMRQKGQRTFRVNLASVCRGRSAAVQDRHDVVSIKSVTTTKTTTEKIDTYVVSIIKNSTVSAPFGSISLRIAAAAAQQCNSGTMSWYAVGLAW